MDPKWRLGEQNIYQAKTLTCAVRALTIQNTLALIAEFQYVINARCLKKMRNFQGGVLVKALAIVNHVQTRIRQTTTTTTIFIRFVLNYKQIFT